MTARRARVKDEPAHAGAYQPRTAAAPVYAPPRDGANGPTIQDVAEQRVFGLMQADQAKRFDDTRDGVRSFEAGVVQNCFHVHRDQEFVAQDHRPRSTPSIERID